MKMKATFSCSSQVFRVDPLIGCGNLLSFVEWLTDYFSREEQSAWSLVMLDLNYFKRINDERGHSFGDKVLHWVGLVLQDEMHMPVYRVGGDEFFVVLQGSAFAAHTALAHAVLDRLAYEAVQLQVPANVVSCAVLHYAAEERWQIGEVLVQANTAMILNKQNRQIDFREFSAQELRQLADPLAARGNTHRLAVQNIVHRLVDQIVDFGVLLDETQNIAYTDQVSGLANSRAAQQVLEQIVESGLQEGRVISIFLIDGDNLREYNKISYAAGDEMIHRLGEVLNNNLRPDDFLARWRVGDEFLVILPEVDQEHALVVGERLRSAVQESAGVWELPVTISIGLAVCPQHGSNARDLLKQAELALERAKTSGKNRVESAGKLPG